jgi:hypothetical protein
MHFALTKSKLSNVHHHGTKFETGVSFEPCNRNLHFFISLVFKLLKLLSSHQKHCISPFCIVFVFMYTWTNEYWSLALNISSHSTMMNDLLTNKHCAKWMNALVRNSLYFIPECRMSVLHYWDSVSPAVDFIISANEVELP